MHEFKLIEKEKSRDSNYPTIEEQENRLKILLKNHELEYFEIPQPDIINLSVVAVCNLKCRMCYNWKLSSKDSVTAEKYKMQLSIDEWEKIILSLRNTFKNNNIEVAFTGSESLLEENIYRLISFTKKKFGFVSLHSNGSLITDKTAILLKSSGLDQVALSLDSIYEKEHNTMRGSNNSYKRVLQSIDCLSKFEIPVVINTVLCSYNIAKIEELIEWSENNEKIKVIRLQAIIRPFNTEPNLEWYKNKEFSAIWPDNRLAGKILDNLVKNKANYSKLGNDTDQLAAFKKYFLEPEKFMKNFGCNVGSKILNIGPYGSASICPKHSSQPLSDLPIEKLWESNYLKEIYHSMKACTENCHLVLNCAYEKE